MTKKDLATLIGFILFMLGMTSICLTLVGMRFSFLSWLDQTPLIGFLSKVFMVVTGIVIVVLNKTDWKSEIDQAEM